MRRVVPALAAALALALVVGCGGDDDDEQPADQGDESQQEAKKGGDLTVMYAADVDKIDPGQTYYQYGMNVAYATQRPLYSYQPDDASNLEPDLAESAPEISEDGQTVTVKIRTGVKFSPPVDREVTSADVKYGLERGFTPEVAGPYVGAYMGSLKGLKAFQDGNADEIAGIKTPDDQTIVLELEAPRGAIVAAALSMPASAPVPKEYAQKFDKRQPSAYGENQVATGPYMVENDESGKITGYTAGTEIRLVRNPNWDAATDYKPAYLDSITFKEGNDPDVASRQILEGDGMVSGDFQLPAQILSSVSQGDQKDLMELSPPTGRFRYIAVRTDRPPFDDINVRKALNAALNKEALRQAFGGPITGDIPTHFIPPGQPGFEEAGGDKGTGADFMAQPKGNLELAKEYMRKAGYDSGMYDGPALTGVSDNATQQKNVTQVAVEQFKQLGFEVKMRYVVRDSMYTKYCQVPSNQPDVCPSVGWLKDFADPETLLNPVFNGKNILEEANSNFALLDDPAINKQMDEAEVVNDPAERNQAWGEVDKSVTDAAAAIPWLWDTQAMLRSENVNAVVGQNLATWDLAFTSIK
ncbi:MAG TPA: ABC transporter substrate-binding protein [Solirubrobacteraceae bacterium]|nr:ABC transporter substrate-binding protein [Solirubrobacteraceae bacterium]